MQGTRDKPVELAEPSSGKAWRVVRRGLEVTQVTGTPGKKPRETTRTLADVEAAKDFVVKAWAKKQKEGYRPTDGHLDPVPVDTFDYADGMENVYGESGILFFHTVPGSVAVEDHEGRVKKDPKLKVSDARPPSRDAELRPYGLAFFDGPNGSALLPEVTPVLLRGDALVPTQPLLRGGLAAFGFWKQGHPHRHDGAAMLVAHDKVLYELTIADAKYRRIGDMPDQGLHAYAYLADGARAVHWWGEALSVVDLATGESRPIGAYDKRIVGVVALHDGKVAVLTQTELQILDGAKFEVLESQPWTAAKALGSLDGGRMLVVGRQMSSHHDRHGVTCYAAHGRLVEIGRYPYDLVAAFDARGRQYLRLSRRVLQVMGARSCWSSMRGTGGRQAQASEMG